MEKATLLIMLFAPMYLFSQEKSVVKNNYYAGIKWTVDISWDSVKVKAKKENKYIFVDCNATWCLPCKKMDVETFSSDTVGEIVNAGFISIKAQLDSNSKDPDDIKKQYSFASMLTRQYHIAEVPTFLFFDNEGNPIHKESGFKNKTEFLTIIKEVSQPEKQYYTLVEKFSKGALDEKGLLELALHAKKLNEKERSQVVAKALVEYLDSHDINLLNQNTIMLVQSFSDRIALKSKVFNLLLKHGDKVDSLANEKGFSIQYLNGIIYNSEIQPALKLAASNKSSPNWRRLEQHINDKYGSTYAEPLILSAKVNWSKSKKDWKKYSKYYVLLVDKSLSKERKLDAWTFMYLNNAAFEVFNYSHNKNELYKALKWIDLALGFDSYLKTAGMDTKAGILYKLGRVHEAISIQEDAIKLDPNFNALRENLSKMKQGLPTWKN